MKTFVDFCAEAAVKQKDLNPVEFAPGEDALINKNSRKRKQDSVAGESYVPESVSIGEYSLVKTKEKKPTIAHPDGKHVHEIHHNGKKIGTISPYSSYKDTKKPGAKIVSNRKDVTKYQVQFDKDHGPESHKIATVSKMGHSHPNHAFEAGVTVHRDWKKSQNESYVPESNDKFIQYKPGDKVKYETSKHSRDNKGVVHSHKGDTVTIKGHDWLGKETLIDVHRLAVRKESVNEATKGERSMMAYVEKRAVKAAEKANVGAMSRPDKEAWIDQYIKDNSIPKGAMGSAVYSGVMKVRPMKEEKGPCWDGYKQVGMKKKNGKTVPNCVPESVGHAGQTLTITKDGKTTHVHKLPADAKMHHIAQELRKSHGHLGDFEITSAARNLASGKDHKTGTTHMSVKKSAPKEMESVQLDEILTFAGRLKRARDIKKNKAKLAMGKERQANRIASKERLQDRAKRHARAALIARMTKGIPKGELSMQRRAEIERRLERMKNVQTVIARKLLPQVRKDELEKKRGDKTTKKDEKK